MCDFAVVVYDDVHVLAFHKNIFNIITDKIKNLFYPKRIFIERICNNSMTEKGRGWVIHIREDRKKFDKKKARFINKYIKYIFELCAKNSIGELYLGKSIKQLLQRDELPFGGNIKCIKGGTVLYTSVVKNIINMVCIRRGWALENVEVCIINFSNNNMLLPLIKLLAEDIKFVTVITENKLEFMQEVERIYNDTGNAIRIASDFKSGVKDCNIVITFDSFNNFKQRGVFTSDMALINISNTIIKEYVYIKSEVINSVKLDIPAINSFDSIYKERIENEFDSLEALEILFRASDYIDWRDVVQCYLQFKDLGIQINGLIGRNGII